MCKTTFYAKIFLDLCMYVGLCIKQHDCCMGCGYIYSLLPYFPTLTTCIVACISANVPLDDSGMILVYVEKSEGNGS